MRESDTSRSSTQPAHASSSQMPTFSCITTNFQVKTRPFFRDDTPTTEQGPSSLLMRNTLTGTFFLPLSILTTIAFFSIAAQAQLPAPKPNVHVIPQPRQMNVTADKFSLSAGVGIVLADSRSEDDRFAAQDFS